MWCGCICHWSTSSAAHRFKHQLRHTVPERRRWQHCAAKQSIFQVICDLNQSSALCWRQGAAAVNGCSCSCCCQGLQFVHHPAPCCRSCRIICVAHTCDCPIIYVWCSRRQPRSQPSSAAVCGPASIVPATPILKMCGVTKPMYWYYYLVDPWHGK
jgi:hypothetical protein